MSTETPVRERQQTAAERMTERESAPGIVHSLVAALRRLFGRPEDARETLGALSEVEHHATWALTISVDPDECDGGFVAWCAEVPGAMGQGDTEEEAARDLLDAVSAIAEVRLAETFEVARERADDGPRVVNVQL